jgi:hypothetical protein
MNAMYGHRTGKCEKSATVTARLPNTPLIWEAFIQQPELMHHLQCKGMDGVPAEIAEEIGMLLEHDDRHSDAGQHQAKHHPGRSSADDATLS